VWTVLALTPGVATDATPFLFLVHSQWRDSLIGGGISLHSLPLNLTMPNYFLINPNGNKQGPVNEERLQELAASGFITPNTPLETDTGHKGTAGQIPGLKFNNAVPPPGNAKKDIGAFVQKVVGPFDSDPESIPLLSRFTFIFLAVSTGVFGIHDFYAKRIGPGAIHLTCLGPLILLFGVVD
jgi:hypothetical protein